MEWAFLAPWWRVIQAFEPTICTGVSLPHSLQSSQPLGLSVRLPPRTLPTNDDASPEGDLVHVCALLRDALELVLLLSIVDPSTTLRDLTRHGDDAQPPWLHVDLIRSTSQPDPGFAKWMLAAVSALLVPQSQSKRSPEFRRGRAQILAAIPENDTETRAACAKMKISIGVGADWDNLTKTILPAVATIMSERNSVLKSKTGSELPAFPFCAAEIDAQVLLSPDSLLAIAQLDAMGMQHGRELSFRNLQMHHANCTPDSMAYGNMLVALCRPIACAVWHAKLETTRRTRTLTTLSPSLPSTPGSIRQLWLALMYSREIQSLHIEWPSPATSRLRQHHTHWIAHALFSQWSRHAIQHVKISRFGPTLADVGDLRAFLASNTPSSSLLQSQSTATTTIHSSADTTQVHVAANTAVTLHPVSLRRPNTIVLAETAWLDVAVDNIASDPEYCDVVVPAYGLCRLRREDIVTRRSVEHTSRNGQSHNVTSLELSTPHWAPRLAPVCEFLGLVGHPLRTISLVGAYPINATFWDAIFENCPSIECLRVWTLHGDQARAREALHPRQQSGIIEFFQALADPSTRISQTLCELSFSMNPKVRYALKDDEADAIAKMLRSNKNLRFGTT